jgi:Type IX secretion system membrane protein PorP/SprF
MKSFIILLFACFFATAALAGNDSKRGQAGATELLINPWAKSQGYAGAGTAMITGVESMRFNVAGLAHTQKTELILGHSRWLVGSDIFINSVGFAQKLGENGGTLGLSLMSVDFGELVETTFFQPEGTGSTFRPVFFNMGLSYAKIFSNSISGGITVRMINESISNATASGVAFDAGVQYQTGERKQFKFGVALRNWGPNMRYSGDGLSFRGTTPSGGGDYQIRVDQRSESYEIPTLLNIGVAYDFQLAVDHRITPLFNFVSNSFTKDQIQFGAEYGFRNIFMARVGYDYRQGIFDKENRTDAYSGLALGFTIQYPFGEEGDKSAGIDFAYRTTDYFAGTATIGLRLTL